MSRRNEDVSGISYESIVLRVGEIQFNVNNGLTMTSVYLRRYTYTVLESSTWLEAPKSNSRHETAVF